MTKDCWKDFVLSGKVSDYLSYRRQTERLERRQTERLERRETEPVATNGVEHGTDDHTDRHGGVRNACGGI